MREAGGGGEALPQTPVRRFCFFFCSQAAVFDSVFFSFDTPFFLLFFPCVFLWIYCSLNISKIKNPKTVGYPRPFSSPKTSQHLILSYFSSEGDEETKKTCYHVYETTKHKTQEISKKRRQAWLAWLGCGGFGRKHVSPQQTWTAKTQTMETMSFPTNETWRNVSFGKARGFKPLLKTGVPLASQNNAFLLCCTCPCTRKYSFC